MNKTTNPLLNAERGKRLTFAMAALLGLGAASAHAQTNNYFGISGTLSGTVWSVNTAGPYTSALVTTGGTIINFNNVATFTGARACHALWRKSELSMREVKASQ